MRVKRFDPRSLKAHRIIIIVGKRGTGKSVMQRDLMKHLADKIDFGMAMTPTEETCEMYRQHLPEAWIYNSFSVDKLDECLQMQRDRAKSKKTRSAIILMDDCMYDKKVLKGIGIRDLFMNGRHLSITLCNAVQYVMDMGPDLRTQVDYIFALRENIISNKNKLWKYFFGMFEKYDDFARVMDKCTENHSAIVMDNTIGSTEPENCIFWYKAEIDHPEFKMGKPIYWQLSEKYMKTQLERQDEENDRKELQKMVGLSKKKRIICVQREDANGKVLTEQELLLL